MLHRIYTLCPFKPSILSDYAYSLYLPIANESSNRSGGRVGVNTRCHIVYQHTRVLVNGKLVRRNSRINYDSVSGLLFTRSSVCSGMVVFPNHTKPDKFFRAYMPYKGCISSAITIRDIPE